MLKQIGIILAKGGKVRLVGFRAFSVTKRQPSKGRNPRTGKPIDLSSASQAKFRPGKVLKDLFR